MDNLPETGLQPDEWYGLKAFTDARIALGSAGVSLPIKAVLDLRLAHAQAKDAVYAALDVDNLKQVLEGTGVTVHCIKSKAQDREVYLQRPDLGRILDEASHQFLTALAAAPSDISIIIADGLSATAVNSYSAVFVQDFLNRAKGYTIAPIMLGSMARVAIADEIGYLLNARLTIILIGERPGLSASDSMGAYITYGPLPGTTDEKRNCVSNIRNQGLPPQLAAEKVMGIVDRAFQFQLTGVQLKDDGTLLMQIKS